VNIRRSIALLVPIAISACSGPSLYAPLPQSAFAYPNSDVSPGTHVRATVTRSYIYPFQTPHYGDAEMRREAYVDALKGTDGDLIIDGDFTMTSKMIPLGFVNIFTVNATVEGTAAKIVQVGPRQK
jgi:hypothetical protein